MASIGQRIKVREEANGWILVDDFTEHEIGTVMQVYPVPYETMALIVVDGGRANLAVPNGDLSAYDADEVP